MPAMGFVIKSISENALSDILCDALYHKAEDISIMTLFAFFEIL